jgi:hypothetical protein
MKIENIMQFLRIPYPPPILGCQMHCKNASRILGKEERMFYRRRRRRSGRGRNSSKGMVS